MTEYDLCKQVLQAVYHPRSVSELVLALTHTRGVVSSTVSSRERVTALPLAFKAWREERRWSQKEAAAVATKVARDHTGSQEARVSPSTIAMIETGERQPSVEVLEWLAEAYGVPAGALALVKPVPAEAVA